MTQARGTLVKFEDKVADMRATLTTTMKSELEAALGRWIEPAHFVRVALTTFRKNPKILECDKGSVLGAIVECAQLGLELDSVIGTAYLVPFKQECTLIIGYKGFATLALRSGFVNSIDARLVYEKDMFRVEEGTSPRIKHVRSMEADRGALVAAYAVAHMRRGVPKFEVMSFAELEKVKKRAPSARRTDGPWHTDEHEMYRKCPVRRMSKLLPMGTNSQLARAVAIDERGEIGMSQDLNFNLPSDNKVTPLDALAGKEQPLDAEIVEHATDCGVNAPGGGAKCDCGAK